VKTKVNKRIRRLRRELDLTQQEFADRIGIKRNTLSTYESGRNEPIDAVISLICREFNVNEEWLRTGEGDMFVQQSIDDKIASFIGGIQMTEDNSFKRRLISVLANLKEEQWEMLAEIAENLTTEKG
jgi:Predicted transcriptional regulator